LFRSQFTQALEVDFLHLWRRVADGHELSVTQWLSPALGCDTC
jgi:hypothetical protein